MNLRGVHDQMRKLSDRSRTRDVKAGVDDDDCAYVESPSNCLVVTSDFINSSPAIVELGVGSWRELGWLAVCHNLADLAGSAAKPLYYLSGICVTKNTTETELIEFTEGVVDACVHHKCALIGGDTKFGVSRAIYGTALGVPLSCAGPFQRRHANPNHLIVASRPLGDFAASVLAVSLGSGIFGVELVNQALANLSHMEVCFEVAEALASSGTVCAGTDISDGLATDLRDLCRSSNVGATVEPDSIPVSQFVNCIAESMGVPPWSFAFASGGDFASIYSVRPDLADLARARGGTVIGNFLPESRTLTAGRLNLAIDHLGHVADRSVSFSQEIQACVEGIKQTYGN